MSESVLLDTCGLLWLATGHRNLSENAKKRINQANLLTVSAISAWEIGLKTARGELELPEEPETWFEQVVAHHDLRAHEISTLGSLSKPTASHGIITIPQIGLSSPRPCFTACQSSPLMATSPNMALKFFVKNQTAN
jgi:hypothetical protein